MTTNGTNGRNAWNEQWDEAWKASHPRAERREIWGRYMAGREWALLKRAVLQRAGEWCERCSRHPVAQIHHVTYLRRFHELETDLLALCDLCHEFLSGRRDEDPATEQEASDDATQF